MRGFLTRPRTVMKIIPSHGLAVISAQGQGEQMPGHTGFLFGGHGPSGGYNGSYGQGPWENSHSHTVFREVWACESIRAPGTRGLSCGREPRTLTPGGRANPELHCAWQGLTVLRSGRTTRVENPGEPQNLRPHTHKMLWGVAGLSCLNQMLRDMEPTSAETPAFLLRLSGP